MYYGKTINDGSLCMYNFEFFDWCFMVWELLSDFQPISHVHNNNYATSSLRLKMISNYKRKVFITTKS